MRNKELKKMSRKELIEILIEEEQENTRLKEELRRAEAKSHDREILINRSGTLAEAALALNKVFEAGDAAVKQYVDNIKQCNDRQQEEYDRIIADAKSRAAEIINNAECEKMRKMRAADNYWNQMTERSKAIYQSLQGIKEIVDIPDERESNETK